MGQAAGALRGSKWRAVFVLMGGLCTTVAWYLPWFTMHFSTPQPLGGPPSSPVVESPYTVAGQNVSNQFTWVLLLAGIALLGLGLWFVAARNTIAALSAAMGLAVAAGALTVAVVYMLGLMAVPEVVFGHAAPGVYLVPEPGGALMLAGITSVVVATVHTWQRIMST